MTANTFQGCGAVPRAATVHREPSGRLFTLRFRPVCQGDPASAPDSISARIPRAVRPGPPELTPIQSAQQHIRDWSAQCIADHGINATIRAQSGIAWVVGRRLTTDLIVPVNPPGNLRRLKRAAAVVAAASRTGENRFAVMDRVSREAAELRLWLLGFTHDASREA